MMNCHAGIATPASMIWRVAARSALPGRIENSSGDAPILTGESANHSIQPMKASAAANARRKSSLSAPNAGERRGEFLSILRIINGK